MPTVREREKILESKIEKFVDGSEEKKKKRICVSFLDHELEKIKTLSKIDGRSMSSYIRTNILNLLPPSP